jgi:prevent-host-death family protein
MQIVNIHEAKTNLSKLIKSAKAGDEVIIAKAGEPVAKLIPHKKGTVKRIPGIWKGKVWISPDFDEEDEKINEMFFGK